MSILLLLEYSGIYQQVLLIDIIITIASSNLTNLPTITHQVNNESVRELGLLRERDEVRGYYDLLGAPRSVTARML